MKLGASLLFAVALLGLAAAKPVNPSVSKLVKDVHALQATHNGTRSLEEQNYGDLNDEFNDMATVLSQTFPYHGRPHSDYAQDCVSYLVRRKKLKWRVKQMDPQGENNLQRGRQHAELVGRLAMSAHDCAYYDVAKKQGFNLKKSVDFTMPAENDDDVRENSDTETENEYGGKTGTKLGGGHEVASGKKLLSKIEDQFRTGNKQEMADLRMILVMIAVTDVSWGANPKVNYLSMMQEKVPGTEKKWQKYLLDPDQNTVNNAFSRARSTGMDLIAHASDLGYFLEHFRVFVEGEERNPLQLCHLLACFGEFYSYGGVSVNAVTGGKNTDKFFAQWDTFLKAQPNFRKFVWGNHLKSVLYPREFKYVDYLEDLFLAELRHATDKIQAWALESSISSPRNPPATVCQLLYGLIKFAPSDVLDFKKVSKGVANPNDKVGFQMLSTYATNGQCADHLAFEECDFTRDLYPEA